MGTEEKFCLKWNDFHSNVSKSFATIRNDVALQDVTLIGNDHKKVSAHRLVLSACSEVFRDLFQSMPHSNPYLYLDSFDSQEILLVLDYIYQGEVQIHQENLNRFLELADKLKLEGLQDNGGNADDSEIAVDEDEKLIRKETKQDITDRKPKRSTSTIMQRTEKVEEESLHEEFDSNRSEVETKFNEIVVKENSLYKCTVCGKAVKDKFNMRNHIETHIEGLVYECRTCQKTFRSNASLRQHTSKFNHYY